MKPRDAQKLISEGLTNNILELKRIEAYSKAHGKFSCKVDYY